MGVRVDEAGQDDIAVEVLDRGLRGNVADQVNLPSSTANALAKDVSSVPVKI